MAEAVGCPMPRNFVKANNFSQSSVDVSACVVISSMKALVFSNVRAALLCDLQYATVCKSSIVR